MRLSAQGLILRHARTAGRNQPFRARQRMFSLVANNGEARSMEPKFLPAKDLSICSFSSQSKMNLLDILSAEHNEEVSSRNTEIPQALSDLKAKLETTWRVVDDAASTQMFSKDKKVQISFHCQNAVDQMDSEEYEDEEPVSPFHFTITVPKAGKTLTIDCLSDSGLVRVESVRTTVSDVEDENMYQGPDFLELDESLQDAFSAYIEEELSIDSDVAAFIAMYSDYKEQIQYVQFLHDVQRIVE
eukprot:scaffold22577_cov122-Cylindrotheca_fusiformis.AAC.9